MRKIKNQSKKCSQNEIFFKTFLFKRNYAGAFDVSCTCFSNDISLVLRDGDADSENVGLIWRSVSDSQKTCSSKGASLIGT